MAEILRKAQPAEKQRRLSQAYKAVFDPASPQARRVLRDLYRRAGMKETGFVQGFPDATSFNAGRRYVGLRIEAMCSLDESRLVAVLTEREEDE